MATPTLALRCTDHPTYMAKRKPTADCKACRQLWSLVQTIPGVVVLSDNEVDKLFTLPIEPPKMPDLTQEIKLDYAPLEVRVMVPEMLDYLNKKYGDTYKFTATEGKSYFKVIQEDAKYPGTHKSVYAFVAKKGLCTNGLGKIRAGAVLKPASWSAPAKHERAWIFDKETWAGAFSAYGVAYMK